MASPEDIEYEICIDAGRHVQAVYHTYTECPEEEL